MNEQSVKLKFINEVTNANKLKDYEKRLTNIRKLMSNMPNSIQINNELENAAESASKVDKNMKSAFDTVKFGVFVASLKKVANVMTSLITKSSSYLENINLYQVAFNGAYKEADKFVDKITEMYGLDESWAVRTVGIFRQLANAMGLATQQADQLSYLMTQMSIDISSLYNVDIDRASQVLQSALAGQTRPIRSVTGADITMNTLQQTLNELGIEKAVNQLSFAEKRLVIIISLTRQLQKATNDFGRTIESPANQMRILNEQWERLTRAVGNVFLPIVAKILPYLNAILMTLTEIINAIAKLFGYKEEDYDYFTGIADSVLDLEEGLDGASESAKKLKQGLRGFDKLNVITTPSASSSGAGAGSGINADIAKAYDEAYTKYMNSLKNVKMEATRIRDKIMEWLGFTKEIDALTGEVSFKYQGFGTTLKNLLKWWTKLNGIAKVFVALGIVTAFKSLFNILKKIGTTLVSTLIPTTATLIKYFGELYKNTGMLGASITATIKDNQELVTGLNGVKLALEGIIMLISGLTLISSAIKSMKEDGIGWINVIELVGGAVLVFIGTINILIPLLTALGVTFTATWAAATMGISLVITAITALVAYFVTATSTVDEYKESMDKMEESARGYLDTGLATINRVQELVDELNVLVDANGNVKKSDEDRVNYILTKVNDAYETEYQLIDGKITANGNEIKSNDELIKSIDQVMRKKKEEAILNAYQDVYAEALRQNNKLITEAKQLQEGKTTLTKKEKKQLEELQKAVAENATTILKYEALEKAHMEGNVDEASRIMKYFYDDSETTYDEAFGKLNAATETTMSNIEKTCSLTSDEINKNFNNVTWKASLTLDTTKATENFNAFGRGVANSGLGLSFYSVPYTHYANGGLPPVGQVFIANEKGPELVDQIGGQTFVANQKQIGEYMDKRYGSYSQPINLTMPVEIGGQNIGTIVLNNLQDMAKANGKPIVIGG